MTPLMLAIVCGKKDSQLLQIIEELERLQFRMDGGGGLSMLEEDTLMLAYDRLNRITAPGA